MRDGWLTMTVVLLDLLRRRPAGARLLLAVTRVPLAVTRVPLVVTRVLVVATRVPLTETHRRAAVNAVPRNFRSVGKHGMMLSGADSLFGAHETVSRASR